MIRNVQNLFKCNKIEFLNPITLLSGVDNVNLNQGLNTDIVL